MDRSRARETPTLAGERPGDVFLRRNDAHYRALASQLLDGRRDDETTAWCVAHLAEFCQFYHTGRFADGRLENLLLQIGRRLPSQGGQKALRGVLHVTTSVQSVGGHTRTIKHWIESDPSTRHSLLITWQGGEEVPGWLVETVRARGGEVVIFPEDTPLLTRASWLREAARSADLVVLHHFGYDVVPVLAFAEEGGPPVAVLNHADHLFWLGSSVADTVIQQRGASRVLSDRRFTTQDTVLPTPLADRVAPGDRACARERLGVPPGATMLLSVGRGCKYIPTRAHHFVRTAGRILELHPQAHLYVVGVRPDDEKVCAGARPHPRLHLLGTVEDPSLYRDAADVYLEGFPFGSQTALLEASLAAVPSVLAFAPPFDLLVANDEALDGLLVNPPSEDAYIEQVGELIRDAGARARLGARLRERVLACHTGDHWQRCLEDVYGHARALRHAPRPIPETACEATERDVALSTWQAFHEGNDAAWDDLRAAARALLLATAYFVRQAGHYRASLGLLCGSLRRWGWSGKTARAAAALVPHWALRRLRGAGHGSRPPLQPLGARR